MFPRSVINLVTQILPKFLLERELSHLSLALRVCESGDDKPLM